MTFSIKNMITVPGKIIAKRILESMNLKYTILELGQVEIEGDITAEQRIELKAALHECGLDLLEDRREQLVENVKKVVIEMVYYRDEPLMIKNSNYISQRLNRDYTYVASVFSQKLGITIEHYIIAHKIERAKEMLLYGDCSLTTIAYRLHYSSVAHLSMQFKKVTGFTPTSFKQLKVKTLTPMENVGIGQMIPQTV